MDISKYFYKKCFDYYLKLVFFKSLLHTPSQFFVKEKLVRVYVGVGVSFCRRRSLQGIPSPPCGLLPYYC